MIDQHSFTAHAGEVSGQRAESWPPRRRRALPMFAVVALICLVPSVRVSAVDYHIDPVNGSDSNNGLSLATAWRTLYRSTWEGTGVVPGDTVWLASGTYSSFWIERSGAPGQPISYRALPGHTPIIQGNENSWFGIGSHRSTYLVLDGITVRGPVPDPVSWLAEAEINAIPGTTPLPRFNGNGISIGRLNPLDIDRPHHITIRNCTVHNWGGGGISLILVDYVIVEGNSVYNNCWYTRYANSGISFGGIDFDQGGGYRNVIRGNRCWRNFTQVKWYVLDPPAISDGNGIIVDDSRNTQYTSGKRNEAGDPLPAYTGRTLIANNLCVANGGSGIHTYLSDRVDIIHNTAWQNGAVVGYPEIFANASAEVRIVGNIMSARDGGRCNSNHNNVEVLYDGNLYWNGTVAISGPSDRSADPRFIAPGSDLLVADFGLQPDSPAIDAALAPVWIELAHDLLGVLRPQGQQRDLGALERPMIRVIRLLTTAEPELVAPVSRAAEGGSGAWSWNGLDAALDQTIGFLSVLIDPG